MYLAFSKSHIALINGSYDSNIMPKMSQNVPFSFLLIIFLLTRMRMECRKRMSVTIVYVPIRTKDLSIEK